MIKRKERKDIFNGIVAQLHTEHWHHIPRAHNPDRDLLAWTHNWNEFSIERQAKFDQHLQRIAMLKNSYHRYIKNPYTQVKKILFDEPAFYSMGEVLSYLRRNV